MKRLISMLLVLTVCLSLCVCASAAAKPLEFVSQPSTQTVRAGGNCQFSVNCKNQKTITWHFVDPDTEEDITGKNLIQHFKNYNSAKSKAEQFAVSNPNSKTITLKHVPEEMHGWKVYCTIGTTKSNQLDSDVVYLLIKGKPAPGEAEPSGSESEPDEDEEEPADEDEEEPADEDEEDPADAYEEEPADDEGLDEDEAAYDLDEEEPVKKASSKGKAEPSEDEEDVSKSKNITVKAINALVYPISDKPLTNGGVTECTLPAPTSFEVSANGDAVGWLVNGVTIIPSGPQNSLTILFADKDITIEALTELPSTPTDLEEADLEEADEDEEKPAGKDTDKTGSEAKTASATKESEVDTSKMCTVKCENCRFTGGDYQYVTNGKVPYGTVITVVASSDGDTAKGYSINGGEYGGKNKATVKIQVFEDCTISMQKRKGA